MKFLGLGIPELIIILVVILLIFGPKNLPKLGKAFGKSVSNLREGMNEAPLRMLPPKMRPLMAKRRRRPRSKPPSMRLRKLQKRPLRKATLLQHPPSLKKLPRKS